VTDERPKSKPFVFVDFVRSQRRELNAAILGKLKEDEFRFDHNEDPMATEKLSEGIRNFVIDQNKLEDALSQKL
jgi:transaldolase